MTLGGHRATPRSRFDVWQSCHDLCALNRVVSPVRALCRRRPAYREDLSLSADLSGPWPDMSVEPWRQGIVSSSLAANVVRAAIPRGNPIRARPRNSLWRSAMLASRMTAIHFAERLLLIKQQFGQQEYGTGRYIRTITATATGRRDGERVRDRVTGPTDRRDTSWKGGLAVSVRCAILVSGMSTRFQRTRNTRSVVP